MCLISTAKLLIIIELRKSLCVFVVFYCVFLWCFVVCFCGKSFYTFVAFCFTLLRYIQKHQHEIALMLYIIKEP